MELVCVIQNYAWGKKGSESMVARLCKNADKSFQIDENLTYSELWMGTHVNGPSVLKKGGEELSSIIKRHPEYLGDEVLKLFKGELPFLFKVLSVGKAISIHAHPSKKHAEELHKQFPHIYKDPNHKPELAIALTPVEGLCGFRVTSEIRKFVIEIPELRNLVGRYVRISDDDEFLRRSFHEVLTCDQGLIRENIKNLVNRLAAADEKYKQKYLAEVVCRLHMQYPYDSGIFMVYFLNYMILEPPQAVYVDANVPHSYFSGDFVECMACSDNVVRAGLTPKFVDIERLCRMLNYTGEPKEAKIFHPEVEDHYTKVYRPPIRDYAIVQINVPGNKQHFDVTPRNSASFVLVVSGNGILNGKRLVPGCAYFLPANHVLEIENSNNISLYQAIANVK